MTITSASPSYINVTVPFGATLGHISVTNKTIGRIGQSTKPFNPTFIGGPITTTSFGSKKDIISSFNIEGLQVADLDGDGWNDLAVANNEANSINIYRNLEQGEGISLSTFAPAVTFKTVGYSTNYGGLQIVDMDGDGKLDAVASVGKQFSAASFAILKNKSTPGNIMFDTAIYVVGNSDETPPYLVADIDKDCRAEMIGGESSNSVITYLWIAQNISNPEIIEFGSSRGYFNATVDAVSGVSISDLDNDGKPELLVSTGFGTYFSIIKNNSTPGTLALKDLGSITTGQYNTSLQALDLNDDGKNDLVWKKYGKIYIRLNTNSGAALSINDFATEIILDFTDEYNSGGITLSDINGDGRPDIVVTINGVGGVFENIYDGVTFNASSFKPILKLTPLGVLSNPTNQIIADLNGDQKPDIIVGHSNNKISIFQNNIAHSTNSVSNAFLQDLVIMPNPAESSLTIKLNAPAPITSTIQIGNSLGQEMTNKTFFGQ